MELMNQYDEWFGDSPARGINEPVPMMNIWGRPIRAEADVIEIYKRSLEEGSPGRNISAVKRPRVRSNSEIAAAGNGQAVFCYENLPPEGRNNPARPDGRLIDCISCWIRRSRAGHQVPSPMLSGVSGNYVFFYPD